MTSWKIGNVSVTRLIELEFEALNEPSAPLIADATPDALKGIPWLTPDFVSEAGLMKINIQALLIDAPGMKMVVDTCIGNGKLRPAMPKLDTPFLENLAAAGFDRNEIDIVICTHLHYDHVGWNTMFEDGRWVPTFPNARYLLAQKEYDFWLANDGPDALDTPAMMADSIQPLFDAGLVSLVTPEHRISAEISLRPTEGHTPGHVSVVIESDGERGVITGDMVHHPCQIAHPEWASAIDFSPAASQATREREFAEWIAGDTLVIGTHFSGPSAGRLVRDGAGFRLGKA